MWSLILPGEATNPLKLISLVWITVEHVSCPFDSVNTVSQDFPQSYKSNPKGITETFMNFDL